MTSRIIDVPVSRQLIVDGIQEKLTQYGVLRDYPGETVRDILWPGQQDQVLLKLILESTEETEVKLIKFNGESS